jgi:hypothetical protein
VHVLLTRSSEINQQFRRLCNRQSLLQHCELESRINELVDGSVEDVLMLAR